MPRHCNPDLTKDWKLPIPATVAGAVEFELLDPVTKKPRYGERTRLVTQLLANWLRERGYNVLVDTPPSQDLMQPKTTPETTS
jgi:hypothetical protein